MSADPEFPLQVWSGRQLSRVSLEPPAMEVVYLHSADEGTIEYVFYHKTCEHFAVLSFRTDVDRIYDLTVLNSRFQPTCSILDILPSANRKVITGAWTNHINTILLLVKTKGQTFCKLELYLLDLSVGKCDVITGWDGNAGDGYLAPPVFCGPSTAVAVIGSNKIVSVDIQSGHVKNITTGQMVFAFDNNMFSYIYKKGKREGIGLCDIANNTNKVIWNNVKWYPPHILGYPFYSLALDQFFFQMIPRGYVKAIPTLHVLDRKTGILKDSGLIIGEGLAGRP